MQIIRIAIIAVAACALLLACEDKNAPEPEAKDTTEVAAPTEPAAAEPSAEELEAKFADEAKKTITADNAEDVAAELEKEIESDAE